MKKLLFTIFILFGIFSLIFSIVPVSANDKCTMDIQCGTGKTCVEGVCVGGIVPEIQGKCKEGNFGKKVCSNTGEECSNDAECF